MAYLAAVPDTVDGESTSMLFIDWVFGQHVLSLAIVSDRDPRFTMKFRKSVFKVLATRLDISTENHPQTDGQTDRLNCIIGDICAVFALKRQIAGAQCSLSLSLP